MRNAPLSLMIAMALNAGLAAPCFSEGDKPREARFGVLSLTANMETTSPQQSAAVKGTLRIIAETTATKRIVFGPNGSSNVYAVSRSSDERSSAGLSVYLLRHPEFQSGDSAEFLFSADELSSYAGPWMYIYAEASGYYSTCRRLPLNPQSEARSVAELRGYSGLLQSVTVQLVKMGAPFALSGKSEQRRLGDDATVDICEQAAQEGTSCTIDRMPGEALCVPLDLSMLINSTCGVAIYPYTLKFSRPVLVRLKPRRRARDGSFVAVTPVRVIPENAFAEYPSASMARYTADGWIEFEVNAGGMYYAVDWAPRTPEEAKKIKPPRTVKGSK